MKSGPLARWIGVREVIGRSKRREARIMTSVLTTVEVFSCKMPVGLETLFSGLIKRINRQCVDTKVTSLAHDLRD